MARLPSKQKTFDEPKDVFAPILPGKYTAQINKSDYKETNESMKRGEQAIKKDPFGGNSYYQQYNFTILEGQYSGRIIFCRLHVKNLNSKTEENDNQRAHQLGRILGRPNFSDTEELHGIPMIIRVRITKAKGKYPEGNDVNGFYPLDDNAEVSSHTSAKSTNEPDEDWEDDNEKTESEAITENKGAEVDEDWEDQFSEDDNPDGSVSDDSQYEVSFD